jgi:hypothetical protein
MKSTSNEDRARHFMKYGFQAEFDEDIHVYIPEELDDMTDSISRDYIKEKILDAAKPYINDLSFAFSSPKSKLADCSEIEMEAFDDLDQLSTETLQILAKAMAKKN